MKKQRYFAIISLVCGMNAEAMSDYNKMEERTPFQPPVKQLKKIQTYLNKKFELKLREKRIERIKSFLNEKDKNKDKADKLLINLGSLAKAEMAESNMQANGKEDKNLEQYMGDILGKIKQELTPKSNSQQTQQEPPTNSSTKNAFRQPVYTMKNKNTVVYSSQKNQQQIAVEEPRNIASDREGAIIYPPIENIIDITKNFDIFITKEQFEKNDVPEHLQQYLISYKEKHPDKQLQENKCYKVKFNIAKKQSANFSNNKGRLVVKLFQFLFKK